MSAVVLDVEADAGGGQAEENGQRQRLPPGVGNKHQQQIGRCEGESENRGLEVHLPAVALPASAGAEEFLDAPAKLPLKIIALPELQPSAQFCRGSDFRRGAVRNRLLIDHVGVLDCEEGERAGRSACRATDLPIAFLRGDCCGGANRAEKKRRGRTPGGIRPRRLSRQLAVRPVWLTLYTSTCRHYLPEPISRSPRR